MIMNLCRTVLLLFSCIAILCACDGQDPKTETGGGPGSKVGRPAPEAGYITARPQRIALTNELPGRVKAYRTAEIRPQVSGIIQSRLFKEGSFVEKDQQLYQIDPARYDADHQRARANLQNAMAELQTASSLARRYRRLIGAKAVSAQEYDEAVADVEKAKAAVALAEAEVKTAKINLDYTKVHAPISGYIGPSGVTEGALVTAQQQTALATIRQLDPVYIDLSQSAAEARQLQERIMADRLDGKTETEYNVVLLPGNTGETYPHVGALDATDLSVDQQTGTIRLRTVFPNPATILLPGMFVRASLKLAEAAESIIVPQKSVAIGPGGAKSVWVIGENNTVEKRRIRTGAPYENNWVVLEGLQIGDRVIVEGTMMLREGASVKPVELDASDVAGVRELPSDTPDDRAPPPDSAWREPEAAGPIGEISEPEPEPNPEPAKTAAPREESGAE